MNELNNIQDELRLIRIQLEMHNEIQMALRAVIGILSLVISLSIVSLIIAMWGIASVAL